MLVELCAMRIHFVPLDPNSPKLFGFSEFLAGLALMILAWTIADTRYRFRIWSAPVPLYGSTFVIMTAVGTLALLTDLWRAQGWFVPKVIFFTPASWQALLAGTYFLTFIVWAFFAFIKPPTFGKWNARRFAQTLFGVIVKGVPAELAVAADELRRSAKAIVFYATERAGLPRALHNPATKTKEPPKAERYANDILSLIADKRFCRAIIESSPSTAWAFFGEMGEQGKHGIQIQTFANNIVGEAMENKNSFLFHETAGYESGLIGGYKPICQAIFSNYEMVETVDTLLDADFSSSSRWDSEQWEAYCRVVLMTFRDYVEKGDGEHSYVLFRAMESIKNAPSDLYTLDGTAGSRWREDGWARLRVVVKFIKDAIEVLERKGAPAGLRRRNRRGSTQGPRSICDRVADLIYEVIYHASYVKSPRDLCWWIQYNTLWGELFNFDHLNGQVGSVVKSKVCRLLYNDVLEMSRFPNFKGAKILGCCLNVMGLERRNGNYVNDSRALHKAILTWTKKNFAWLYDYNPRIAEACLVDGIAYDAENLRIVRTYPAGLSREPQYTFLNVDPPPTREENESHSRPDAGELDLE